MQKGCRISIATRWRLKNEIQRMGGPDFASRLPTYSPDGDIRVSFFIRAFLRGHGEKEFHLRPPPKTAFSPSDCFFSLFRAIFPQRYHNIPEITTLQYKKA